VLKMPNNPENVQQALEVADRAYVLENGRDLGNRDRMLRRRSLRRSLQIARGLTFALLTVLTTLSAQQCTRAGQVHEVAEAGNLAAVDRLVSSNPKLVNSRSAERQYTPLHYAVANDHYAVALLLLRRGADPNARDSDGQTPLFFPRSKSMAELLVRRGAQVSITDKRGCDTPLLSAAESDHEDVVQYLRRHGARVTTIHEAAFFGDLTKARALLRKNESLARNEDTASVTPLHVAARRGHLSVAELLIRRGALVDGRDAEGATPLMFAAEAGELPTAELLLNSGADPNAHSPVGGDTVLHLAARGGNAQLAELLVKRGARVNVVIDPPFREHSVTALDVAVAGGHKAAAEVIRRHGGKKAGEQQVSPNH
jgi:ankyrin repeat protein